MEDWEAGRRTPPEYIPRLLAYQRKFEEKDRRNVSVIQDADGNKIVVINDMVFKGTVAKAKANATQAIPEMIEIASNGIFEENRKSKHGRDAKNGWYRYDTRFALPIYGEDGNVERYNIFRGRILIRHASSGKKYLYDILEIKKETGKSCQT